MTYTEKIMAFFKEKASFFMGNSGIICFTQEDLNDLASFSEQENERAYKIIVENIEKGGQDLDARLCPWCILLDSDCNKCGYGLRHGKCDAYDSVYTRIGDALDGKFDNYIYRNIIKHLGD